MRDHVFTVLWHGAKPSELIARLICKCVYREGGKHCLRSWAEHGRPATSEWRWHEMDASNAIAEAPYGIFDPSWFHELPKLNHSELAVFLVFVSYRHGVTGESQPGIAIIAALTGVHRNTVGRAIKGLVKGGLLTLLRKHTGKSAEHDVYGLPPTIRHDEIMANLKERTATAKSQRRTLHGNDATTAGARPSQDPITPDLPEADRMANLKHLAKISSKLQVKTVPPLDSVFGVKGRDCYVRWLLGTAMTSPTPDVRVKGPLGLKDTVSQNQETPHDGGDDLLAMFARRSQPIGKIPKDGIEADCGYRRHVQHPPQMNVASL